MFLSRRNGYFIGLKLLVFSNASILASFMYMSIFLKQVLGYGNDKIGFVMATIYFMSTFAFSHWGSVVEKTAAYKKLIIWNTLLGLMSTLFIACVSYFLQANLIQTILILFGCIGFSFFVYSLVGLLNAAILRVLADQKVRFGEQQIGMPIGTAISSYVTGHLMDRLGSPYALFIVYTVSSLLLIVTAVFVHFEPHNYEAINDSDDTLRPVLVKSSTGELSSIEDEEITPIMDDSEDNSSTWDLLRSPEGLQFFTAITIAGFTTAILYSFLFLFFERELHASPATIGLLLPVGSSGQVLSHLFSEKIFTCLGASWMLIIGQCIVVVRCVTYLFCPGFAYGIHLAIAVQTLQGVGFGLIMIAAVLQADFIAPPHLRNRAQGLLKLCWIGLSPGFGTIFGGFIFERYGASVMWTVTAIIATCCLPLFSSSGLRKLIFAPLSKALDNILAHRKT